MIEWILENREWLFSGICVFVLTGIIGIMKLRKHKENVNPRTEKVGTSTRNSSSSVTIAGKAKVEGNVAGRDVVINNTSIDSRAEELISILQLRADKIRSQLAQDYHYAPVTNYIAKFEELHAKHIAALEKSNLALAHEILTSIHEVSRDLESDEFWSRHRAEKPDMRYSLRRDAFQRGMLICEYVVGEMRAYSDLYPSDMSYRTGLHKKDGSERIYERILNSKKP